MKRMPIVLAMLTTTAWAAPAQPRPDFAGVWTAVPSASQVAAAGDPRAPGGGMFVRFPTGDMGSGWGSPLTIAQTAEVLTVDYTFFIEYDLQPPLRFRFALDGAETRNVVMMGRGLQEQRSTVAWSGDTLVITTRHIYADTSSGAPPVAEVRRALTIEPQGTLLIQTTRLGVLGGPTTSTVTRYTRK